MGKTSKVVVCGGRGVGKTTILENLIYGNITPKTELHPTIEDIYVASVETDRGTRERLRLFDTAGLVLGAANELPRHYLSFADGYVLIYDPDVPESFETVVGIKKDIDKNRDKKEIAVAVLGNRKSSSNEKGHAVDSGTAAHWAARERVRLYEVDAFNRSTLGEPFVHLASRLNPPPPRSTFPQLGMTRKAKDSG
ncbi:hypothetical protein B566_EDAN005445 [Ephemera danica]|nr:hypothetical protein B566_EDAN005445 [Ephemera danica]